jgi:hypothetical protein
MSQRLEKLDPEQSEVACGVKRALVELRHYASSHAIDPGMGKSIQALANAGALSSETSAFIANHHTRFYGFDPRPTVDQLPVLDVVLVRRPVPLRYVGFADGHVERVPLDRQLLVPLNGSHEA